jgi:hypothetical protein
MNDHGKHRREAHPSDLASEKSSISSRSSYTRSSLACLKCRRLGAHAIHRSPGDDILCGVNTTTISRDHDRSASLRLAIGRAKKKNGDLKHVLQEGNELDTLLVQWYLSFSLLNATPKNTVYKKNPYTFTSHACAWITDNQQPEMYGPAGIGAGYS